MFNLVLTSVVRWIQERKNTGEGKNMRIYKGKYVKDRMYYFQLIIFLFLLLLFVYVSPQLFYHYIQFVDYASFLGPVFHL